VVEAMARVLVVDDDPSIRQVIAYVLRDEGYQVDEAADGRAALAAIGRRHPDVILVDLMMPGMDGWDFVGQYRERYGRRAPILILTAVQGVGRRGVEVDADEVVAKPFDLDALVERVGELVGRGGTAASP
jgi:two-component system response regulator MprA